MTRRTGVVLAASCAALVTIPCLAAGAASARPSGGKLTDRLAKLARSPELREAPPRRQAARLDVAPRGPGSLLTLGDRVVVEVRMTGDTYAGAERLRDAGAAVLHVSRGYRTVSAAALPAALGQLAEVEGVESVIEQLTPITSAAGEPTAEAAGQGGCQGTATSEGDAQLNAAQVREQYGISGKGVEVGIVSDSFDTRSGLATDENDDIASGDLPGSGNPCGFTTRTQVLTDLAGPNASDEGRAMAQIVHDLAPGAALAFTTGFGGQDVMADHIRDLAAQGADVIVDDLTYSDEPFFQAGPIDDAISDVTRDGTVYFSSAGNFNEIVAGTDVGSWETTAFRSSDNCPDGIPIPEPDQDCLDFNPLPGPDEVDRGFRVTIGNGGRLPMIMQWTEPWYGVETDLDFYLLDDSGQLLASSEDDNPGVTESPFEDWTWTNNTGGGADDVRIVVNRAAGSQEPGLKLQMQGATRIESSEYPEDAGGDIVGPTIMGHNGAADAVSVGAVPYDDAESVRTFSSRGPVTHYFRPVKGVEPAEPRPIPLQIPKPDLTASDGVQTTFFSPSTLNPPPFRFTGTSAAAPHAAAVAALQLDATPLATPLKITDAQTGTADPVGEFGVAAGAGLVDALAAVETDTTGPRAQIRVGPDHMTRQRTASFTFSAKEPRARLECKLDSESVTCQKRPKAYKVGRGRHRFSVVAIDQLGNRGDPAVYRWTVRR